MKLEAYLEGEGKGRVTHGMRPSCEATMTSVVGRTARLGAGIVLALGVAGCAGGTVAGGAAPADAAGPGGAAGEVAPFPGVETHGDLRIGLTIEPDTVPAGGALAVRLDIENTGSRMVELESVCPVLSFIHVVFDGTQIPVRGAGGNCFNAVTHFEVPPGQILSETWQIAAERRDGEELGPGPYVVETQFLVPELPNVEARFVVEE